jgi:hypothetical protein
VGGCDIVKEMFEKGELKKMLKNKSLIWFPKKNYIRIF